MNIYEKLSQARLNFQNENKKKSGKNNYAGYTYYELADILPVCNKICAELKMLCVVSFNHEIGILTVIDSEKPEDKIEFTTPMSSATLKGCHDVQNVGAVETYLKRYLYQNAFEIIESDEFDATTGEFEMLVAKINDYASRGVLSPKAINSVNKAMNDHDIQKLRETIKYCESKAGGNNDNN